MPQQWHKPPTDKIEAEPVMKSTFAKSCKDKEKKKKRAPVNCKLYDANAKRVKAIENERNIKAMRYTLSKEEGKPPFSYLLQDQQSIQSVNTIFGNVPLGSYLAYQLVDERNRKVSLTINRLESETLISGNQPDIVLPFPDIPFPVNDNQEFDKVRSERPPEEQFFLQRI